MLLLSKVKLTWIEIVDGVETEKTEFFEGFTFEAIQEKMLKFMEEKNIDIVKNKCKTEVLG